MAARGLVSAEDTDQNFLDFQSIEDEYFDFSPREVEDSSDEENLTQSADVEETEDLDDENSFTDRQINMEGTIVRSTTATSVASAEVNSFPVPQSRIADQAGCKCSCIDKFYSDEITLARYTALSMDKNTGDGMIMAKLSTFMNRLPQTANTKRKIQTGRKTRMGLHA